MGTKVVICHFDSRTNLNKATREREMGEGTLKTNWQVFAQRSAGSNACSAVQ